MNIGPLTAELFHKMADHLDQSDRGEPMDQDVLDAALKLSLRPS